MEFYLKIAQVIVSVSLIVAILLQTRGTSLGGAFGGTGTIYSTKRGIEKILFYLTIGLSVLFFGLTLANLIIL